jgi:hypothetical protein
VHRAAVCERDRDDERREQKSENSHRPPEVSQSAPTISA